MATPLPHQTPVYRRIKAAPPVSSDVVDYFLNKVSHDLRSPLSAILLWSKLLNSSSNPPTPAELSEGLEAITSSALEQHAMIERLLDASLLMAGNLRLQPKPVVLDTLAHNAAEHTRSAATLRGVQVNATLCGDTASVPADARRLQQILTCLLNHVITSASLGAAVRVRAERRGAVIELGVEGASGDAGSLQRARALLKAVVIGRAHVWKDGPKPDLDVYVMQQLIRLHGGSLRVLRGTSERGTRLIATLPLPSPSVPALRQVKSRRIRIDKKSTRGSKGTKQAF